MIKKCIRIFAGIMCAGCIAAMLGIVGAIDGGAALADVVPAAFALIGGAGLFGGIAYLAG